MRYWNLRRRKNEAQGKDKEQTHSRAAQVPL